MKEQWVAKLEALLKDKLRVEIEIYQGLFLVETFSTEYPYDLKQRVLANNLDEALNKF